MSAMVLDAGNSIIKAKIARREDGEAAYPHAFRKLTEAEHANILAWAEISDPPEGYLRINIKPYAVEDREPFSQWIDARLSGNAIALAARTARSMIDNKYESKVLRRLALRAIPLSINPGNYCTE